MNAVDGIVVIVIAFGVVATIALWRGWGITFTARHKETELQLTTAKTTLRRRRRPPKGRESMTEEQKPARKPTKLFFHTKDYSGKDPAKKLDHQQRLANTSKVEAYLNSIAKAEIQTLEVGIIAGELSMDVEDVRAVLNENGKGYNGITF